jgi:uroporphyrinogen-III decarboxylase
VKALLAAVPARGHIMNLGHGITPDAPIESVHAIVDAVHAENAS